MFIFANKKVLKASLLVDDNAFQKLVKTNRINAFAILFCMIGAWLLYQFKVIPDGEATTQTLLGLIACSVVGCFLLLDAHLEKKFYKELLDKQSNENLFSQDELSKIKASLAPSSENTDSI